MLGLMYLQASTVSFGHCWSTYPPPSLLPPPPQTRGGGLFLPWTSNMHHRSVVCGLRHGNKLHDLPEGSPPLTRAQIRSEHTATMTQAT